ncbi:unnamed protein product [Closterium sp. NIES-53]
MLREKENKRAQQQEVMFSEREEDEGVRDKVKDSKEKKRAQQQEMLFSEREAKRRRGWKEVEGNGELGLQGGETAGCEEVQKVGSRFRGEVKEALDPRGIILSLDPRDIMTSLGVMGQGWLAELVRKHARAAMRSMPRCVRRRRKVGKTADVEGAVCQEQ